VSVYGTIKSDATRQGHGKGPATSNKRQASSLPQLESIRNYESYRCIKNYWIIIEAFEDARLGLRSTCKRMQNRREACEGPRLCLLRLLCIEGLLCYYKKIREERRKLQASSSTDKSPKDARRKQQASSPKRQASSSKPQAASSRTLDPS
jgi:hypothetical protein